MLLPSLAVAFGIAVLVWGADRFVVGASGVARNLGVSPLIVGLTIVGFGTSAPEMLVSGVAAYTENPGLCVGNAIGSNITNAGLVLGLAALVRPLAVHTNVIRRELPILIGTTLAAFLLMIDGDLNRFDGLALGLGMFLMMGWIVRQGLRERRARSDEEETEVEADLPPPMSPWKATFWVIVGLAALLGSSHTLVWGATEIAELFGVSNLVIGLTVVALGTSLPELAASIVGALKNEHDIAIGNVVGSNMFNLLGVLSLPGLIAPGALPQGVIARDYPVMIAVTVLMLVLARGFRVRSLITRIDGLLLIVFYAGYVAMLFAQHDL